MDEPFGMTPRFSFLFWDGVGMAGWIGGQELMSAAFLMSAFHIYFLDGAGKGHGWDVTGRKMK